MICPAIRKKVGWPFPSAEEGASLQLLGTEVAGGVSAHRRAPLGPTTQLQLRRTALLGWLLGVRPDQTPKAQPLAAVAESQQWGPRPCRDGALERDAERSRCWARRPGMAREETKIRMKKQCQHSE